MIHRVAVHIYIKYTHKNSLYFLRVYLCTYTCEKKNQEGVLMIMAIIYDLNLNRGLYSCIASIVKHKLTVIRKYDIHLQTLFWMY